MAITSEPFSEFPNRSNGEGDAAFSPIGSPTYSSAPSFSPSISKLFRSQSEFHAD